MTLDTIEFTSALHPGVAVQAVEPGRLTRVRAAYTTRFVAAETDSRPHAFRLLTGADVVPQPGDVLIARVTEIGKHMRLESPVSRRQLLFPGQEIMVAYGHRYAPDQFLAKVPASLEPCHLVAGGGVAGVVTAMHASINAPTAIEPVGLLADDEGVVNLARFAPLRSGRPAGESAFRPPVVAVLGSSMNSGKSTTLGCLVNGLTNAGLSVAAGKATGTGSGNDPNLFKDSGAVRAIDFTDYGHPTTFQLEYGEVRALLVSMVEELAADAPDAIVIEIADGLYQGETGRLLRDPVLHETVDRVLFASQDALGASAGLQMLGAAGLEVAAVSGVLTASPLAAAEAGAVLDIPVVGTFDLCRAEVALGLLPARRGQA